ncbi:MAG: helix-turn-helix transcriptional regulator [Methanosphaera sp.]|nr:helix-turn-helix transcriptional regulator [Methanobrevibacter sp.]MBQ6754202.1 helix-turn-helix transcriptional regulator [Bacteroidales bacterium]MBR0351356.1 helix-turn-helix transcriptional regulator [Clostridia bacterium]MBR0473240.1 helix-turn-helix transcriptional regulator [Methanosphaera sp.]
MNNFSNNLKQLRLKKGLTQEELAKRLDKNYTTIGKWEKGIRSPILDDLIKLADIFGITIDKLVRSDFNE